MKEEHNLILTNKQLASILFLMGTISKNNVIKQLVENSYLNGSEADNVANIISDLYNIINKNHLKWDKAKEILKKCDTSGNLNDNISYTIIKVRGVRTARLVHNGSVFFLTLSDIKELTSTDKRWKLNEIRYLPEAVRSFPYKIEYCINNMVDNKFPYYEVGCEAVRDWAVEELIQKMEK